MQRFVAVTLSLMLFTGAALLAAASSTPLTFA